MTFLATRWRIGLSLFAVLAFVGLGLAAKHYRHAYNAEKALRASDRALYVAAQAEAARLAQEALRATEARYAMKAKEADSAYQTDLADVGLAADRYIARMRVKASPGSTGATPPATTDNGSGVPQDLPAGFVMVSEADVRNASDWQAYGSQCHNFVMGLGE